MATSLSQTPPHPSSTLVNISDDADLRLIRVLAPATSSPSNFETECTTAIQGGDAAKLLRSVISNGAVAGLLEDEFALDEAVSAFSLLTVYLDRVGDASVEKELCAALADCGDDETALVKREKQSAMIAALFNLRSDAGQDRGVSPLADMLDVATLKASLALWGSEIPDEELRALYEAIVRGMDRVLALLSKDTSGDKTKLKKVKAANECKQKYVLFVLATYTEESQLDNTSAKYAEEAQLTSLPAVVALQKSKPALHDLLKIFMDGKLQDYRDFTSMPDKNSVFATFNLDESECAKNMCLLSLVSLAAEHEEIPYSVIASTLEIKDEEVEQWVITGVSSGLMEAKMDQLPMSLSNKRPSAASTTDHQREAWPCLIYRLQSHRGWEVFSPTADENGNNGGSASAGKKAAASKKSSQQTQSMGEELTVAPRKGSIEVRKMRLRVKLFEQNHPRDNTAASTSDATQNPNKEDQNEEQGNDNPDL
ncbi:eukaryotic translation initiation factor 3 subunit M [Skeletonema marinoi]|uniref:Eukaryotic translation initiation factor 3 subunit M n=1 Tax=Skeletonema marinoi TaxID=267567 RepID=A0AAD9DHB7_9STRA|nr:eukaryotic translation initiation factor 3 subunit M [Skeletonema marinoi]